MIFFWGGGKCPIAPSLTMLLHGLKLVILKLVIAKEIKTVKMYNDNNAVINFDDQDVF